MKNTKRFSAVIGKYLYDFDSFVELLTDGKFGFMPPDKMGMVGAYAYQCLNEQDKATIFGAASMADAVMNIIDEHILGEADYQHASTFDRIETELTSDLMREMIVEVTAELQNMIWSCADDDEEYEPPDIFDGDLSTTDDNTLHPQTEDNNHEDKDEDTPHEAE